MNTEVVKVYTENMQDEEQDAILRRAGNILREGGLVAFPTETVYGLGGDALNKESSGKIYAAKGRPSDNPLIVHIADMEALPFIVQEISRETVKIAEAFWPGPLTIVLPKSDKVPMETTGGLNTVAVRMPSHPVARKLIEYAGGYVAAPSANVSGRPSPTLAKYVVEDMNGRIEMILDGGEVGIGLESTIIDMTVSPPQILRPGYVTQAMLEEVLGQVDTDKTILSNESGLAPKAPGMKYRHYAPKGEMMIVSGDSFKVVDYINEVAGEFTKQGKKVGVIASCETLDLYQADVVKNIGSRMEETEIARNLYRILREFDEESVDLIFSEEFCGEGMGQAIMNRMLKAAAHNIVKVNELEIK